MARVLCASVFILLLSILSVGFLRMGQAQTERGNLYTRRRFSIKTLKPKASKTWCVAKPSSSEATLLENINYACSKVDCSILQRGGSCYAPDNVVNHASVAMNLYYQSQGRNSWNCQFKNSGLVTISDPSYGGCTYS